MPKKPLRKIINLTSLLIACGSFAVNAMDNMENEIRPQYKYIKTAKHSTYMGVNPLEQNPKKRLIMRYSPNEQEKENYIWEIIPKDSNYIFKTLSGYVLQFAENHGDACEAIPEYIAIQTPNSIESNYEDHSLDGEYAYGGLKIKNPATGLILNIWGGSSVGVGYVVAYPDDRTWVRDRSFKFVDAPICDLIKIKGEIRDFDFGMDHSKLKKPKETVMVLQEFDIGCDGHKVTHTISKTNNYQESFELTFNQKIGTGIKTTCNSNFIFLGGGVEINGVFEVGSSQKITHQTTKTLTYSTTVEFSKPGYHKVEGMLYEYADMKIPFSAYIIYTGTLQGQPITNLSLLRRALIEKGVVIEEMNEEDKYIKGKLIGEITANTFVSGKTIIR